MHKMTRTKKNKLPDWLRLDLQRWEHWGPVQEFQASLSRSEAVYEGVGLLNYLEAMCGYGGNLATFCAITDVMNVLPRDLKVAIDLAFGECVIAVIEKAVKGKTND